MRQNAVISLIMFFCLMVGSGELIAGEHPRIQEMYLNKSSPQKVYLVPGLASSIKMPCEIDEVVTPTNGIMKHLSERNRSRFSLEVAAGSRSTNFIVHCVSSTYVFDLVVNQRIHNDYIEVIGDYGKPRLTQVPPRLSPKVIFKPSEANGKIIGETLTGERVTLPAWSEETAKVDYKTLPRIKIYESIKGGADAH